MSQRARIVWLLVLGLFNAVNVYGAGYAAVMGEALHGAAHVALLIPGAYAVWRLVPRRVANH